ncbi:hypothetical protein E4U42_006957 [Claviceps africana]|uniref:Uncharacterized protein n=1 Tax=Claviceps africana TaxID=83212 RepID=A0A8K0NFF2_9HYPO|nr:hypothetical protein E4U42_006957 [Claviceps africana]
MSWFNLGKSLALLTSSSTERVPSLSVQLSVEKVADPQTEGCMMKDDDSMKITRPDFEVEHIDASKIEATKESKRPTENLGDQLASPVLDDDVTLAVKQGNAEYMDSLHDLCSIQNCNSSMLTERIQALEAENAKLLSSAAWYEYRFMAEKKRHKEYISTLLERFRTHQENASIWKRSSKILKSQIADLRQRERDLAASYEAVQKELHQRKADPGPSAALAIGSKVFDGELKSEWKQLKFSIRNLALLIVDSIPEDRCPPLGKRLKRLSGGKTPKSSRRIFSDPDSRSWAIEKSLWSTVCNIVFESQSGSDLDEAGHSFKHFKKVMLDRLEAHKSTRLGLYCKWFNDGWQITRPSEGAIETMLQNDCGRIYQLVYGDSQLKDGADELSIQDELRDIFKLAMELDDMCMQSRAIITLCWHARDPREHGSSGPGYVEATMNAVNMDQKPPEDARIQFVITPALLKRGNANGRNYDSEMVLAKADVFMYREEDQTECGDADPFDVGK